MVLKETINRNISDGFEYSFSLSEGGLYIIEITAGAKSWWQNLGRFKFGDDDLALKIDDRDFPKLNGKRGLFDGEVAWNGNNLGGFLKTDVFFIRLDPGGHKLIFNADNQPFLGNIKISKAENEAEIFYTPENNNPAQDGNGRQWITFVAVDSTVSRINMIASAKSYENQRDCDDVKLIIDGNIQSNEQEADGKYKYWYWVGKILHGQEKEFDKTVNLKNGMHYIELWADRMPLLKNVKLYLGKYSEKRIPTVGDPEWSGDFEFEDDTEQMILSRAIFGEARSISEKGKIAVGWSIKNRVLDERWADTYHKVILQPYQYSAFNKDDPNFSRLINPFAKQLEVKSWYECFNIAGKVMNGIAGDPTEGANHYFADNIAYPNWTKQNNAQFKIKIDNTLFYDLKAKGFALLLLVFLISFSSIFLSTVAKDNYNNRDDKCGTFTFSIIDNEVQKKACIRITRLTGDNYEKSRLKWNPKNGKLGYWIFLNSQNPPDGKVDYENYIALQIMDNDGDNQKEIYRGNYHTSDWNWLDEKNVEVAISCGTGCVASKVINIETGEKSIDYKFFPSVR